MLARSPRCAAARAYCPRGSSKSTAVSRAEMRWSSADPTGSRSAAASSPMALRMRARSKVAPGDKWGPGSLAGWVRGWGLGGTPSGAVDSTLGRHGGFLPAKLFSASGPPRAPPALRARSMRQIDGQIDMPAIGKFDISQMDAKSSLAAAAALDHIACANREPAGQIICERGHPKILLGSNNPSWNLPPPNARPARQFRDGAGFGHDFCESLWTRRSRTQPRCTDDPARRNRQLGDALQARNRTARLEASAIKDRSRCPGPRPL